MLSRHHPCARWTLPGTGPRPYLSRVEKLKRDCISMGSDSQSRWRPGAPKERIMTNQTSGDVDRAASESSAEHPPTVQGNFDGRSCPPIDIFREPDLVPSPSISNAPNSSGANGNTGRKTGEVKRFMVFGGNSKRTPKKGKPKKSLNGKSRVKRFSSK
jgi:hypothetical protein